MMLGLIVIDTIGSFYAFNKASNDLLNDKFNK